MRLQKRRSCNIVYVCTGRVRSLSEVSYHAVRVKRRAAHLVPPVLFVLERDLITSVRINLSLNIVVGNIDDEEYRFGDPARRACEGAS